MRKIILGILLVALVCCSCVYYNTFFLAKKYYNKAENIRLDSEEDDLSSEAADLYTKAITKASKVLAVYPDSKFIPDALFLIGMCYYWTGDYIKSIRKFDELTYAFPNSKFVEDSQYYRALCELKLGRFVTAYESLLALQRDEKFKERASFMLAELHYEKKDYPKAIAAYKTYLEEYPDSDKQGFIYYRLGHIYYSQEFYQEALNMLLKIERGTIRSTDFFESQLLIGDCLYKVGRIADAIGHYESIASNELYRRFWGKVELALGDVYYLEDDTAQARSIWEGIPVSYPRTEEAAWAYYKLGLMYQNKYGDFTTAREMYELAYSEAPRDSDIKELARQKSFSMGKLEEYKELLTDTTQSYVEVQIKLAEMYLMELEHVDSAVSSYQNILRHYSEDSLAPKAVYSIGWIYENMKKDSKKADEYYSILLTDYPETDYAFGAVEYFKSRGAALDSLRVKTVAYYFVKAEEFLFTYEWEDSALKYYNYVIENYNGSQFVPKAMAAKAYIYENILYNNEKASETYQELANMFPGTDYEELALVKLGEKEPEVEKKRREETEERKVEKEEMPEEIPEEEEEDIAGVIPEVPREWIKERGELIYPEFKVQRDLLGRKVQTEIFINYFGEVKEVKLKTPTNDAVIDTALVRAARSTIFDWTIEDFKGDKWYRYIMRITEPERDVDYRFEGTPLQNR
ncbi:tetratricopeptide repeat protein [bacterium]|nr:tetratricopeptide repeat protein [bacterium]